MGNDQPQSRVKNPSTGPKSKNIFNISGGNLGLDYTLNEEILEEFEEKRISDWDQNDILEWLDAIEFSELIEKFRGAIMDSEDLSSLKIQNPIFQTLKVERSKLFQVYLHHIRKCLNPSQKKNDEEINFSMNFHLVLLKVLKIFSLDELDIDQLQSHCAMLSEESNILHNFLDQRKLDDEEVKVKLVLSESNYDPKVMLSKKILTPFITSSPTVLKLCGEKVDSCEIKIMSSIVIGQFILYWDESELIIPRRIEFGDDLLVDDSSPITINTGKTFEELRKKISKVIVRWNSRKYFFNPKNKKEQQQQTKKLRTEGNCQDFIMDMCKELGIDLGNNNNNNSPLLSKMISTLEEEGKVELMSFEPTKEFEEDFKLGQFAYSDSWERLEESGNFLILFGKHIHLDDFLFHCYHSNLAGMHLQKYKESFRILKCFDRVFWYRYFLLTSKKSTTTTEEEEEEIEKVKPSEATEDRVFGKDVLNFKSGCVFEDPRGVVIFFSPPDQTDFSFFFSN